VARSGADSGGGLPRPSVVAWALALALLVAFADLVALRLRYPERVVLSGALMLSIAGVHAAAAAVAGGLAVVGGWFRASRRRWLLAVGWLGLVLVAIATGIALAKWNGPFLLRRGAPAWGLLFALLGGWLLWVWALRQRRPWLSRMAVLGGVALALMLLAANTALFPGTNRPQHGTLGLFFWAFGLPAVLALGRPRVSRAVGAALWLLLTGLAVAGSMRADVAGSALRIAVRELAPNASAVLALGAPLADLDGDGYPSGFGGGDCGPLSASVSPGAAEVPGDGVDNNCLGGDTTREAIEDLATRLGSGESEGPAAPAVLLLTFDALRHDARLPEVAARLAGRCRHFDGHATNTRTTFSMFSLFTSRFPSEAELTTRGAYWVPAEDRSASVGSALIQAGFATGAAAFNHIFDARYGIARGFEEIWIAGTQQAVVEGVAGSQTAEMAISWLRGRAAPYFLWVHMYDPHEPYLPHPGGPPPSAPPRALYDAEVAFADRQAARVLDALGEGLAQVAVVVTGDHGEAFGEHGTYFHNTSLYGEEIRVPLWVCPPAGAPLPEARGQASLIDVAPTILDLADVRRPPSFRGRSLLLGRGEPVPVFAETIRVDTALQAVRVGRWKLIRYVTSNALLLFDLEVDPGEVDDRYEEEPEIAASLVAILDAWRGMVDGEGSRPRETRPTGAPVD
jgi:hypothetical protein